jgi:hypothetical protein
MRRTATIEKEEHKFVLLSFKILRDSRNCRHLNRFAGPKSSNAPVFALLDFLLGFPMYFSSIPVST